MRRAAKATLVALLAAGWLSGCAHPPPESAPAPGPLDQATVDMLTNSGTYPERRYRVARADLARTESCMRDAGVPWSGTVDPPNPDADAGGAVSVDWVRHHGYGLSDGDPTSGGQPDAAPGDDDRLRAALFGPESARARLVAPTGAVYWYSTQGCAARAHADVYGDLDTWARITYVPQEVDLTLYHQAIGDQRYRAALDDWRGCMSRHHYRYASPSDITTQLAAAYRTDPEPLPQRRAKEIQIALRDLRCNQAVHLSETGLHLRREYAQRIDPRQRAELARLAARFDAAEQRSS